MDWTSFWSGLLGTVVGTVPIGLLVSYYGSRSGTHVAEQEERGER